MRCLLWAGALPFVAVISCVPKDGGFDTVRDLVRDRAGADVRWQYAQAQAPDGESSEKVATLLQTPVGATQAVQIALLNNANLQAAFEEIGIARGQLLGATLLPNPEVQGTVLFGADEDPTDLGFEVTENLSRLVFVPMRRGAAKAELVAEKVRAALRSLKLVYDVRSAFYDYQADEQLLEIARTVLEAAAASYEIGQRLREAGNITSLDLLNEKAFYEEARVAAANAEIVALNRREDLNVLMGLSGGDTTWQLAGRLGDPAEDVPELATLEQRAITRSLDLLELEQRYTAAARRANLARAEGLLPDLRAGVEAERENGSWQLGPTVAIKLPLLDQGQAAVGAAKAEMRQIRRRYTARSVRLRAAARAARNQLVTAKRRVKHYHDVLLPLRQEIVEASQRQYNAMQIGVFQLLDAKRAQVRVGKEYIVALRNYWRARATVDQIVAGRLVSVSDPLVMSGATQLTVNQGEH